MTEELQTLLEKINRDGVEKANAEAARIVADAKAKAASIVKEAEAEAAAAAARAADEAERSAARAAETISQSARDAVLRVEQAVSALFEKLLAEKVDAALSDPAVSAGLVAEAVKALAAGEAEIAVAPKLAEALRAELAGRGCFTVVTDEALGTGFSVKLEGGRVEHAFTGAVVAEAIAARLRPELARLVK